MKRRIIIVVSTFFLALVLTAQFAFADSYRRGRTYEVTITNITRGQVFSPPVVISHKWGFRLFELGAPAAYWLYPLAEDGLTDPLTGFVSGLSSVRDYSVAAGPVLPGGSVTLTVVARGHYKYISVAGMLISSNDAFFAVRNKKISRWGKVTAHAMAYDAGSEANNEDCAFIPGPPCKNGGDSRPEESAEGYVHIHAGIQGIADLPPEDHDWRNPVAILTIRPVR